MVFLSLEIQMLSADRESYLFMVLKKFYVSTITYGKSTPIPESTLIFWPPFIQPDPKNILLQ